MFRNEQYAITKVHQEIKMTVIHCGACMQDMKDEEDFKNHFCPEKGLLSIINSVVLDRLDQIGHPTAHFIDSFNRAARLNLLRRYAYSVADDLDILERTKLHSQLCGCFGFEYKEFRPFESEKVSTKLTREEALIFLCEFLFEKGNALLKIKEQP